MTFGVGRGSAARRSDPREGYACKSACNPLHGSLAGDRDHAAAQDPLRCDRLPASPAGRQHTTPRSLATARAALVRSEMIRRSACATTAMLPTIISLPSGMTAAANRTPAFRSPSRKCASRLRRSSLAITSVAPCTPAGSERPAQLGAVVPAAALDLGVLGDQPPPTAVGNRPRPCAGPPVHDTTFREEKPVFDPRPFRLSAALSKPCAFGPPVTI
jgi:hypothetical protein